ncbi:6-phosphofructokinase [Acetanaerobacterium sp. MSJ-12]|uniref:ATP-dependent 6-phosphofructokinase n=1 Tax=Bittarella massiliensis (ex Durand et al. 2017) TaxID=1720313 RepID=A0AAW5KAH3_9FIRM|nr:MULTISPECIES: 6-phosphofructokinase [Oscillospiraceae]MBC2870666.1 6-phosphofructokinase [Bittarella massiliensis (ex Durand et al. 2017)]MBU5419384.1 6-phosphofructokinase [Acetanaerobacterium sp. MSJ-12]MCQ4948907.1 6-phosphofructokinase [Bittarella massiliensis (ex Durand et al. 2017)]
MHTDKEIKTIGVLTSGGDAPGMNAAIRAVVRTAISMGIKVKGIMRGYSGLLNEEIMDMSIRSVSEIIQRGGTILYTARCLEFKEMSGVMKGKEMCEKHGIDGLVVIGGDGSFRGAQDLSNVGVPCIGVPGTIDNDIACSEYTIGYDTAMNTAMEMVDKLRDTAHSHERCSVVEVMGRRAGHIALNTGIACGACVILVPEKPFDPQKDLLDRIRYSQSVGKRHFIVVVAEGVGSAGDIAGLIQNTLGIDSRTTVLGHVQRGGSPTLRDRVMATKMGYRAVELLSQNIGNRVVAIQKGELVDFEINEALAMHKTIDERLLNIGHAISI